MTDLHIGELARLKNSGPYAPTFRIMARTQDGKLIARDVNLPKSVPLVAPEEDWEKKVEDEE